MAHAKFHTIKINASIICSTLNVETSKLQIEKYNKIK